MPPPKPPVRPPPPRRAMPGPAAQARFAALGQQVREGCARGDFRGALASARQALAMAPGHPVVLGDLGLCLMRLGELDAALAAYRQAVKADPMNENVLDGLTECCGRLGLDDAVREHGRQALALKAAQVASGAAWPLPRPRPPAFDAGRPERNVIAFSLFGAQPRYGETAVLNVHEARRLLPAWRCRFHVDARVPASVLSRLEAAGAQVVVMQTHPAREASALMWRFLVLDDPGVDRFLLRDADSLISPREVAAVAAWLDSPCWFHLMRDWPSHSELLLAGMWGGCTGVFRDVATSLQAFSKQPPRLGARLVDQHWLRAHAWPTVRQSVLSHDGVFGFGDALPFPLHPAFDLGPMFHVGANIADLKIEGRVDRPDGSLVHWRLREAQGPEICRYATPCSGGVWSAWLPRVYGPALTAGRWVCEVVG